MNDRGWFELVARNARATSPVAAGANIQPESSLIEDLGLDSLDLVSLMVKIQDELEIELDLEDMSQIRTVMDVMRLLPAQARDAA